MPELDEPEETSGSSMNPLMRRLAPMIYGPTVIFALGEGAIIPLIPTVATQLGADLATAGLVASALVVGKLCGNLPASWVVAKTGERSAMLIASFCALIGASGLLFAPNVAVLAISIFLFGMCSAAFALARHAFMTSRVPFSFRARALALLGGTFRLGMFTGPLVAAGLLTITGVPIAAAWFMVGCIIACVLLVWFGPDPEETFAAAERRQVASGSTPIQMPKTEGIFTTMVTHRGVLSRLGVAAATLAAVRAARDIVLPIWGVSIGLEPERILLIVGIAGAVDFALFYVSGQVMDRFGRLWAAVPAMILMGSGFIVLAFTHEFASAEAWFAGIAVIVGIGNGLSSGILMTLGSDVAPSGNPAPFLGSWRTLTTAGSATAPLLFSAVAAVAPIAIATGLMGAIALLGAAGFIRWVPRYVQR